MRFKIIKMYCENLIQDCWYVTRLEEADGLPYYYGLFRTESEAHSAKKDLEGDL